MTSASKEHAVCLELQGPDREALLKGKGDMTQRFWLKVDDEDEWVLAAIESKVGEQAGGGVRMVRLHAPMKTNLRQIVPAKKLESLPPVRGGDWSLPAIVSDLVDLDDLALTDACVLHTLRMRYHAEDAIYTAIGDVLLAVNPFRRVACCTERSISDLMRMDVSSLPPHMVKTARAAYQAMVAGDELSPRTSPPSPLAIPRLSSRLSSALLTRPGYARTYVRVRTYVRTYVSKLLFTSSPHEAWVRTYVSK